MLCAMRPLALTELGTPECRSASRFILWLAKTLRAPLLLSILYGIVMMGARSLLPLIIGIVIDRGVIDRNQTELLSWGAVMFCLVVVQAITGMLQMRCDFATEKGASFRTMRLVNRQAAYLGANLRDRISAGEVMNIGAGDIEPIGTALSSLSGGVGAAVAVAFVAVLMLSEAWQVGLVVLLGVPMAIWVLNLARGPMRRRRRELRKQQGRLASIALDIAGGLRVLRGIGGEQPFADTYRAESQRTRQIGIVSARAAVFSGIVRTLLNGLIAAGVVWLAADLVLSGRLTVGQLVAFYAYALFLEFPLNKLTLTVESLTMGKVSAERVVQYLRLDRDRPEGGLGQQIAPDAKLADPRSGLVVSLGSFTAVACASPSDAIALSDRLGNYVESGATIGGMPVAALPLPELRERVIVVRSDDYLFAGKLGSEMDPVRGASAEDVLDMAVTASAVDIIDALPDRLDSEMQAGGRNFSGGERQRLRLLRAMLVDPDVLILVEPTSSLDAVTEAGVVQRTRERRRGKTTVVFSTSAVVLGQADEVRYVENSKVVASGSHSGLLTDKRYEALVARGGI